MTVGKEPTNLERGRIPRADRIQRLTIGGVLMVLTLSGLLQQIEWRGVVALLFQAELLVTALAGWCPIYWACRLESGDGSGTE